MPLLYRLPEAARLLGLSLAYIYVLKDAGKIRVRRIGRAARIHRADLEAYAADTPTAPLKYGSEPSGPLLGADQQRLAVERVSDTPKRRRRKSRAKTKARARPRVLQGAPEPPLPAEQQQIAIERAEPELVGEEQPASEPPDHDYALAYETRLRVIRGNYVDGSEEPHLRAVEFTVNAYRQNHPDTSLDDAKQMVLGAIKAARAKEPTTPGLLGDSIR